MIFQTERLFLRQLSEGDSDAFFAVMSNENVMAPIPRPVMNREESDGKLTELIGGYQDLKTVQKVWAVVIQENNEFIGFAGLIVNDEGDWEIAYRLIEEFWGVGYGTEVTKGLIDYGFYNLNLDRIAADVNIANKKSVKILDSFLTPVRDFFNPEDNCTDRRYILLKKDWQKKTDFYAQESERLTYRKLREEDAELWEEFFIDNPNMPYLGIEFNEDTYAMAKQWIDYQLKRYRTNNYGQLATFTKDTNEFVGLIGIVHRDLEKGPAYEITYALKQEFWYKGYGSEAASQMKKYGFENAVSDRFISIVHVDNIGSIKVAKNNGMSVWYDMNYLGMDVHVFSISK